MTRPRLLLTLVGALAVAGCATTAIDDNYKSAQSFASERLGRDLRWLTTDEARNDAAREVDRLLDRPLGVDDAVRIALAHAPALQATLFDSAAESAVVTQSARLPNPVFAFERLVRSEAGIRELELTRTLAISLYDLLLLPARLRIAGVQQEQLR